MEGHLSTPYPLLTPVETEFLRRGENSTKWRFLFCEKCAILPPKSLPAENSPRGGLRLRLRHLYGAAAGRGCGHYRSGCHVFLQCDTGKGYAGRSRNLLIIRFSD